jgi:hypothetical protein
MKRSRTPAVSGRGSERGLRRQCRRTGNGFRFQSCYESGNLLSARALRTNRRVKPQNPIRGALVQLLARFLDMPFFSWAAQYATVLGQSGRAFHSLLEEPAKLLRTQIELHTPTRRLGKGSQKVRQCRKVCLEIRCYSHMVGCGRTPKLLGVLDASRRVLP